MLRSNIISGEMPYYPMSVKEFGAVGDSVTDDTAAIQSAVNEACNSHAKLVFPPPDGINPVSGLYPCYIISSPISVPKNTSRWVLSGLGRCAIQQNTSNKPIFSFAGVDTGDFNIGWVIENFAFQWKTNQPYDKDHLRSSGIEFDSKTAGVNYGVYDFIIRNCEFVNGCRGVAIKQLYATSMGITDLLLGEIAVWGGDFEKLWHGYSTSGALIYLINPPQGQPNNRFSHLYSVQQTNYEYMFTAACVESWNIENVEANFGNGLMFSFSGNSRNVYIRNVHVESASLNNVIEPLSQQNSMFFCNSLTESYINGFEIFNSTLSADRTMFSSNNVGSVIIDGVLIQPPITQSNSAVLSLMGVSDSGSRIQVRSISDIPHTFIQLPLKSGSFNKFDSLQFFSRRTLSFYKNSLSASATVTNESASAIVAELVDAESWVAGIEVFVDSAVTAGSLAVTIFKNGSQLDSGALSVALSSGTFGEAMTAKMKNANYSDYKCAAGDRVHVQIVTSGMSGPTSCKVNVILVDAGPF